MGFFKMFLLNCEYDMLQKAHTFKHANEYCPRCKTSKYSLVDEYHAEIFCDSCGLVIKDSKVNSVLDSIKLAKYNEKQLYKLHHKKRVV